MNTEVTKCARAERSCEKPCLLPVHCKYRPVHVALQVAFRGWAQGTTRFENTSICACVTVTRVFREHLWLPLSHFTFSKVVGYSHLCLAQILVLFGL